ncbi:MAG: hypothetical protein NT027_03915 [Proteobacteria bacterium]|nr:hypothetical protein [Pseudomonadota bacterium]
MEAPKLTLRIDGPHNSPAEENNAPLAFNSFDNQVTMATDQRPVATNRVEPNPFFSDFNFTSGIPASAVSSAAFTNKSEGSRKIVINRALLIGMSLGVIIFAAYKFYFQMNFDQIVNVAKDLASKELNPQTVEQVQGEGQPDGGDALRETLEPRPGLTSKNPYKNVEFSLDSEPRPTLANIPDELEERINTDLASHVYYHRYRAVEQLIAARPNFAEDLLREELVNGKFWLRMIALMGLTDLKHQITTDDVTTALEGVSDELSSRYFERFTNSNRCPAGCRLVLRMSLSHVGHLSRVVILQNLAKFPSSETSKSMVVATFDEDLSVRQFAQNWLLKHPVEESAWREIFDEVFNTANAEVAQVSN